MTNIQIDKQTLSEVCNVHFGVYHPLNNFVSKNDFVSICQKFKFQNNIFFPLPIYLSLNKENYKKIQFKNKILLRYKKTVVCSFKIKEVYKFSFKKKINLAKLIFNTTDLTHPGFNKFLNEQNYCHLSGKILNFNHKILSFHKFSKPEIIKKKLKNHKTIAGFHTRNVPHRSHEWIHKHGLIECEALLIQPLIGQYKEGEFTERLISQVNKYYAEKIYKYKNVYFSYFNSYPRYAGPREALLHALVRKNFGCTHFIVGRDHAGVGNYYKKYESQKLCKKFFKEIKIKIIDVKEPYLCKKCSKIVNKKCYICINLKRDYKFNISGTKIRKNITMNNKISKLIIRPEALKMIKNCSKPIL